MRAKLRRISSELKNFIKKLIRIKGKHSWTRIEQNEDKRVFDKHKDEWRKLNRIERKKFRREKYTYTIFKNLSDEFEQYKDYYVTDKKYLCEIMPRISTEAHSAAGTPFNTIFNDKNYFERLFPNVKFPKSIVRCINGNYFTENYEPISQEEVRRILKAYPEVVFKRTVGSQHGAGIKHVSGEQIVEVFEEFGENYIVQELIKQHSFLANLNDSSVNVIRVITVYWKGQSYILDSRLRIGAPGSFCDHTGFNGVNPIEIGISEDGRICGKAFDDTDGLFIPNIFGKKIEGEIPSYQKMLDIALRGQAIYPTYGILGWDFTVDEDGNPICIEVNSKFPAIKAAQCVNGPIFMKNTVNGKLLLDEIMNTPLKLSDQKLV